MVQWRLLVSLIGLFVATTNAELVVTLEVVPGQAVAGGATVSVEAFLTNNGPDLMILGYQLDLPCSLPSQSGSTGSVVVAATAPIRIFNNSAIASGELPWAFTPQGECDGGPNVGHFCRPATQDTDCPDATCDTSLFVGGLRPIAFAACRFAGSPGPGDPAYTVRASERVYLGTIRYTISSCATGTFDIPFEVLNAPCQNTDLSRVMSALNQCITPNFVPGALVIEGDRCCRPGQPCINTSAACCNEVGGTFSEGVSCQSDPCPCPPGDDAACDDGVFCSGVERCVEGICVTGQAACHDKPQTPFCNEDLDECAQCLLDAHCPDDGNDCTAQRCVAGACTLVLDDGAICSDGDLCTGPDTCMAGKCSGPPSICSDGLECTADSCEMGVGCVFAPLPAGTSCGNPAALPCSAPDTCDGSGSCRANNLPNDSPCTDDENECTRDACSFGSCIHFAMPQGTPCGDPTTSDCDQPDTCNGGTACLPNHLPNDLVCSSDGDDCTRDVCRGGLCIHPPAPFGTACGDPTINNCTEFDACDGLGDCLARNAPDDTPCDDDANDCTIDACKAGICLHRFAAEGAPCGDPTESECDRPDTCSAKGQCAANAQPDGHPCSPDQHECTEDVCFAGICAHPPAPAGTGCGPQGVYNVCFRGFRCDDDGACVPFLGENGTPCSGLPCTDGNRCINGRCRGQTDLCDEGEYCDATLRECVPLVCPEGAMTLKASPPSGVVDARQPHPADNDAAYARTGIGGGWDAEYVRKAELIVVNVPEGTTDGCFSLTETATDASLGPNEISRVYPGEGDAVGGISLVRPITSGAVTQLVYDGTACVAMISHPANVDGGLFADVDDVTTLLAILLGEQVAMHGHYSFDLNHSGAADAGDIPTALNLLLGAGLHAPWIGTALPVIPDCP